MWQMETIFKMVANRILYFLCGKWLLAPIICKLNIFNESAYRLVKNTEAQAKSVNKHLQ